jgi:hypothetical protein
VNARVKETPSVTAFRRLLDHVHWYVIVLALLFVVTIRIDDITPRFVAQSSLIGLALPFFSIISIRRKNQLYEVLGLLTCITGFGIVTSGAGRSTIGAFGVGLFIPYLLLWISRPWVRKFCRFENEKPAVTA